MHEYARYKSPDITPDQDIRRFYCNKINKFAICRKKNCKNYKKNNVEQNKYGVHAKA